jgi:hypothetical protein
MDCDTGSSTWAAAQCALSLGLEKRMLRHGGSKVYLGHPCTALSGHTDVSDSGVGLQECAHQHAATFDLDEQEHKHEYFQAYMAFQEGFERKLEAFLSQHKYTGEQLVALVARDMHRKSAGRAQCGKDSETGDVGLQLREEADIVDVMLASLEYDVFIEMIRIAQRRAQRAR